MSVDSPNPPARAAPSCRPSFDAPCLLEARLRAAVGSAHSPVPPSSHRASDEPLVAASPVDEVQCLAATRAHLQAVDAEAGGSPNETVDPVVLQPSSGLQATCSASAFVATRDGLAAALQLRFDRVLSPGQPGRALVIQDGADTGLAPEEHQALLQVAEQAAAQVVREGSATLRVMLRRSRLGPAELSIAGEGGAPVAVEVANSFRALAAMRRTATDVGARLNVRRLDDGGLFVRCITRWI
jgi:hypothetical protein